MHTVNCLFFGGCATIKCVIYILYFAEEGQDEYEKDGFIVDDVDEEEPDEEEEKADSEEERQKKKKRKKK